MMGAEVARTRPYRQVVRARTAEATVRQILAAARALFASRQYEDVTLEHIAERAKVTVKTIQRRFGAKEGVVLELLDALALEVAGAQEQVVTGDVDGAMAAITGLHERHGDRMVHYRTFEERIPGGPLVKRREEVHHAWVERVFASALPASRAIRHRSIALLVLATDVGTWRLLRRGSGLPAGATSKALRVLVHTALKPGTWRR
jgi:AcrR family transcriptional regulator